MDRSKRPTSECPHQCWPKSRLSWEMVVVFENLFISCSSVVLEIGSLHRAVGSSVGGEVISLSSSPTTSPKKESRVDPHDRGSILSSPPTDIIDAPTIVGHPIVAIRLVGAGPHPDHVILCRRVVASPTSACHVPPCGARSSTYTASNGRAAGPVKSVSLGCDL